MGDVPTHLTTAGLVRPGVAGFLDASGLPGTAGFIVGHRHNLPVVAHVIAQIATRLTTGHHEFRAGPTWHGQGHQGRLESTIRQAVIEPLGTIPRPHGHRSQKRSSVLPASLPAGGVVAETVALGLLGREERSEQHEDEPVGERGDLQQRIGNVECAQPGEQVDHRCRHAEHHHRQGAAQAVFHQGRGLRRRCRADAHPTGTPPLRPAGRGAHADEHRDTTDDEEDDRGRHGLPQHSGLDVRESDDDDHRDDCHHEGTRPHADGCAMDEHLRGAQGGEKEAGAQHHLLPHTTMPPGRVPGGIVKRGDLHQATGLAGAAFVFPASTAVASLRSEAAMASSAPRLRPDIRPRA